MNYSLRTLLLIAAGLSVFCASLVYATPIVGDLYYTFGLLMIAYATIAAIYFRGKRRAYWIGFLILFAVYYCHTVWPTEIRSAYSYFQRAGGMGFTGQGLVTSRLLAGAYEGLHPSDIPGRTSGGLRINPRPDETVGQYIAFTTAGHTAIALALGVGGGLLAQRFASQVLPTTKRPSEHFVSDMDIQ